MLYHTESSPSNQSPSVHFPENAEEVNDWVSRRIASSRQRRTRASAGPPTYAESSSSASSSAAISTVVVEQPARQLAELPANSPVRPTTPADEVEDEDEALVKALSLSQAESEERASKLTIDGVNQEDLKEALRISEVDR